jgi:serine phosphatase RsbU (regulator of sigma subunit)
MQRSKQFWFNTAFVFGCAIALLLLVQSIVGYFFISHRMEGDQRNRDGDRLAARLERDAREGRATDSAAVAQMMDALRKDEDASQEPIAWLRLFDPSGRVLAESGNPLGPSPSRDDVRRLLSGRSPIHRIEKTAAGNIFVNVVPIRLAVRPPASPPEEQSRPGPRLLEIGFYEGSAARGYGILRAVLLINSTAALMLLGAMSLMAYRIKAYLQGQQSEQQLAIARLVQHRLLPVSTSSYGELECAGVCIPAWQVGGDFYDVFVTQAGNTALVVGDVAGKGLGAALVMSLLHGAIRCSTWIGKAEHERATEAINSVLLSSTNQHTFATLFWAYYQAPSLYYINAGHCPPLLLRKSQDRAPEHLGEGGPVVGLLSEATYCQGAVSLEPGDLLVLPTDGVLEAEDSSGEQFGEDRLRRVIEENAERPCAQICEHIVKAVQAFAETNVLRDDLTVMVVRVPMTDRA